MKKLFIILILFSLLPISAFAAFDTSLRYGAKGDPVIELQEFLIDQNYLSTQATGYFGPLTLKAVRAFQSANGLPATGFFSMQSRAKANEILDITSSDDAATQEQVSLPAPIVNQPASVIQAPVIAVELPKFVSAPLEGAVNGSNGGTCVDCIWAGTNVPTKVTIEVDGITYTSDFARDHFFKEYSNSTLDRTDGVSITELNLDNTQNHTWNVDSIVAIDASGNTITGYANMGTLTISKFCNDYNHSYNKTEISCK